MPDATLCCCVRCDFPGGMRRAVPEVGKKTVNKSGGQPINIPNNAFVLTV
jgi:hypothetical protein